MPARVHALKRKSSEPSAALEDVVDRLRQSREVTHNIRAGGKVRELPSPQAILDVVDSLCVALFPTHLSPTSLAGQDVDLFVRNSLSTALLRLTEQLRRGLQFGSGESDAATARARANDIAQDFATALPEIRATLVEDLRAAYRADPEAESIAEILLCYRSATALIYHRLAHALHTRGGRFVPRMISDLAHASTGINIHPGAKIGPGFVIDNGTGVVIGDGVEVGRNVTVFQGVTLGPRNEPGGGNGKPRNPVIGDDVVILAGAAILGPVTVGSGAVIGSNVTVTRDVVPGDTLTQAE